MHSFSMRSTVAAITVNAKSCREYYSLGVFDWQSALAFVNTRKDRPAGLIESLDTPEAASAWLAQELGYSPGHPLTGVEFARLRALRDSAQRVLRARLADRPPTPQDLRQLNQASAAAPRADHLDEEWRASRRFTGSGSADPGDLTELLAALASATILLAADSSADLAECGADDCVVIFVRSDPRQRYHSERCGNRMRAARSYAKRKSNAARDPGSS
jgi:predicted RNA-binding Zn ribbon-like protein